MRLARIFAAGFILILGPGVQGAEPPKNADTLPALMAAVDARLQVATQVARVKRETGAPVLDSAREAAVLGAVRREAARLGFPPEQAVDFFTLQIHASRLWQEHCLSTWKQGRPVPDGPLPDLVRQVRPQMDEATQELLLRWGAWQKSLQQPRLDAISAGLVRSHLMEKGYPIVVADAAAGLSLASAGKFSKP